MPCSRQLSLWVLAFGIITVTWASQLPTNVNNTRDDGNGSDLLTTLIPKFLDQNNINSTPSQTVGVAVSTVQDEDSEHTTLPYDPLIWSEDTTVFDWLTRDTESQNLDVTSTIPPETSTKHSLGMCPNLSTPQEPNSLVKCQCNGSEIFVDGQCQHYTKGSFIDAEMYPMTRKVSVANYKVIIRNVTCNPEKTRLLQFKRGQFHLRLRGDVILLDTAGHLKNLRINNYCIKHYLDEQGDLTWTMMACIPVPSVPRCCPRGEAMQNGSCQPANTPNLLRPPVSADPYSLKGIEWPDITYFQNPLTCTEDPVTTIPFMYKESGLVSLPNGIEHRWVPRDVDDFPNFHSCPDFCVDGKVNSDGSVSYFTSFCYSPPRERHDRICSQKTCLRKCCEQGDIYSNNTFSCIPGPESHFNPQTRQDMSHYTIISGMPFCKIQDLVTGPFTIDEAGLLATENGKYPSTDYCVDTFDYSMPMMGALVCHYNGESQWNNVKGILVPVCYSISLLFLTITIACHLFVPEVQKNGGVHQLCHAIALSIAYASSFVEYALNNSLLGHMSCFTLASFIQFGFLATFFWLNIMCFETWQKIRCLRKMLPSKPFSSWLYMLYAWCIPLIICAVTAGMQHLLPDDVEGVIRPDIGISRCFFNEDAPYFAYFFGPVSVLLLSNAVFLGLTQFNFCKMLQDYKNITNDLKDLGTGEITSNPHATSIMPARQLNNHVNEYKQRLQLFVLMAVCWVTEVLSWKIPPPELWALTDTLNALQGFFIFIIFLSNRNKRKMIAKKFPRVYKALCPCSQGPTKLRKLLFGDGANSNSHVGSISSVSKKISTSTLLTTFTSTFRTSSSSLSISDPPKMSQRSVSLDETVNGVVMLSHKPIRNTKSDSSAQLSEC